ncbi:MAG: hypothetical protein KBD31_02020 [Proteobacteria bacterium]|nr:hypothetical protein [Pseudomonadota bacterium]
MIYNNPLGSSAFSESIPDLKDILFQSDVDSGTYTPTWMLRLDEIFESTIEVQDDDAKDKFTPCFGFKMATRRQISGNRLTQNYASSRVHQSRIWFVVPLDQSTPSLFIKLHDGTIITKTSLVRMMNIGSLFNKVSWKATFEDSHLEHVEIIRDYVLIALSVGTGEQKVFKYKADGALEGQAVSSYDYMTNTGKPPE